MTAASTVGDVGAPPGKSARRRAHDKQQRRDWRQFVGFAPAAILFGVFFIAPLCLIVVYSFWQTKNYELVPGFTTKNYQTIIGTSTYVKTFGKTVLIAFLATITTLGLAFPLCYWLVRYVPKKLQRVSVSSGDPAILDQLSAPGVRVGGDPGRQRRDQLAAQGPGSDPRTDSAVPVRQPRCVHRLGVSVLPVRGTDAVRIAGKVRLAAAACRRRPGRHRPCGPSSPRCSRRCGWRW